MSKHYISALQKKMFRSAFLTAAFTEFISIVALTIDSIVVCRFLGEKEIAAVGIASPFFFLAGIPATCPVLPLHFCEVLRSMQHRLCFRPL